MPSENDRWDGNVDLFSGLPGKKSVEIIRITAEDIAEMTASSSDEYRHIGVFRSEFDKREYRCRPE